MISRTLARLKSTRMIRPPHPATWLALLIPVFAWAQLTYPGYFEFHSGFLPIFNLNDLFHHLGNLAWTPAIGQTSDLLRGEGALPYRLASMALFLGATPVTAVKWVFGVSMLAGAVGMYGWAHRRMGPWPALVAGIVYAFWPVALTTVYVRGALSDAVLLGLLPWAWWAADAAVIPGRKRSGVALALAVAAALWTQTGLALWMAALMLGYILLQAYGGVDAARHRNPLVALLGWTGGILLGSLGLLARIIRSGVSGSATAGFADHLIHPYQLLLAGRAEGPSIAGPYDTLSFDLGVVAFSLAVLSVLPLADLPAASQNDGGFVLGSRIASRRMQAIAIAIVLLMVCLSVSIAASAWRLLPGLTRSLTYPWQLLLLAGPWLAWLAGTGSRALAFLLSREPGGSSGSKRELTALPLFAGLVTLVVLGSYAYLNPPTTTAAIGESPAAIFGDNEIALLDVSARGAPGPGGRAVVSARWQALRPLDQDYTVFVHALTADGARWAQVDTMPQNGKLPTSQWRPGQVITDRYVLDFQPDAPTAQDYRYALGLYLWQTGQRLPVAAVEDPRQGDDKVVIAP